MHSNTAWFWSPFRGVWKVTPSTARQWHWWLLWLWTGVDLGVEIHLHSSDETFTSHYRTYFDPKSPPSTITLTWNNYMHLPEFFVVSTSINFGPGLYCWSICGAGCARRRYRMHVNYLAFWISVYDTQLYTFGATRTQPYTTTSNQCY